MPRSLFALSDVFTNTQAHRWHSHHMVRPDDAVQYIVLAFIGCISVTSMRGFLRNMRKVCCSVICHQLPLVKLPY